MSDLCYTLARVEHLLRRTHRPVQALVMSSEYQTNIHIYIYMS